MDKLSRKGSKSDDLVNDLDYIFNFSLTGNPYKQIFLNPDLINCRRYLNLLPGDEVVLRFSAVVNNLPYLKVLHKETIMNQKIRGLRDDVFPEFRRTCFDLLPDPRNLLLCKELSPRERLERLNNHKHIAVFRNLASDNEYKDRCGHFSKYYRLVEGLLPKEEEQSSTKVLGTILEKQFPQNSQRVYEGIVELINAFKSSEEGQSDRIPIANNEIFNLTQCNTSLFPQ